MKLTFPDICSFGNSLPLHVVFVIPPKAEVLMLRCLQFYFKTLLSVSESLLRTNEVATHDFGTHVYILLFEEFVSNFHRQEV
jgi:hypothetical protein